MFDNHDFLLRNVGYVPKLKQFFSVNMFDNLGYHIRIGRVMLKVLNGALIIAKGSKYIDIGNTSLASQYFHDNW